MSRSETKTENLFRQFYGVGEFDEKSAIDRHYGFKSKNRTDYKGFPDFFKELDEFVIVVEAKAQNHRSAINEVQHYMKVNEIRKDIVGIAVSGQSKARLKADYFLKESDNDECRVFMADSSMLSIENIRHEYWKAKYGESISQEELTKILKSLNDEFNNQNKVRDADRSLFFSGMMIALKDNNFRSVYRGVQAPSREEVRAVSGQLLEAHNLNKEIINAVDKQLKHGINNLSKEYSWRDKFSFIKNVDYPLQQYKCIISKIEEKIFKPFINNEKHDVLGKAYRIFLRRAGRVDNKNIILTPDHIRELMIALAELSVDDVVIDTCTGTGGFLMSAMNDMVIKARGDETVIREIKEKRLIGFEVDPVLFSLACTNMFLHGDGRTNMMYRSSLINDGNESIVESDHDLLAAIQAFKPTKCIINPPYENNNAIKFAMQAIDYLEPNGKLVIIMPTPTLTQNQRGMTDDLLKKARLEFVIKMPEKLFSEQGRTVNTSVFGFTKTPHHSMNKTLYYNLEDDGFVSIQHKGRVDVNDGWKDLKKLVLDVVINKTEVHGVSEKRHILKRSEVNCSGFRIRKAGLGTEVRIGDLFNMEKGSLASDKGTDGPYNFITGAEDWKTHTSFTHNVEALVYVTHAGGSLGRSHYVDGKFVASNLTLILTPKSNSSYPVNLLFYNHLFNERRRQIVADLADGTSKQVIRLDDFENSFIEYLDIDKQDGFSNLFISDYNRRKKKLEQTLNKAKEKMNQNFDKLFV